MQPHDHTGNTFSFAQPDSAPSTQEFTWTANAGVFRSVGAPGTTIASWTYRGPDVPQCGDERAHINLWLHGGRPPTNGAEVEVVLSDFSFTK